MNTRDTMYKTDAPSTVRELSEEVKESAGQAIDSVRGYATKSVDHAGESAKHLRESVTASADQLADKAMQLARRGLEAASQTGVKARQQAERYVDVTGKYVADQPLKSVLIAAAVGAVVAAILVATSRRNRY